MKRRVLLLAGAVAEMAGLEGQVDAAVARRAELVTILIGANDLCASSEAESGLG